MEMKRSMHSMLERGIMDYTNKDLIIDHQRCIDELAEEIDFSNGCIISIADVLDAHYSIVDYFLEKGKDEKRVGGIGPRDKGLLSSAVARQWVGYGRKTKWTTEYEKCATLFYGLIKNHPFHDCNKRTALLTALYYLSKINRTPNIRHRELERLTLSVASNELWNKKKFQSFKYLEDGEILFLAKYLKKISRPLDKRHYVITYNELNKILGKFGYFLDNPHNNSIDVMRIDKKFSFLGFRKNIKSDVRVGVIGFPGWTREVPRKEMKYLREVTNLTAKDGFDSQVIYKGAKPISSLINEFNGLLQRLADK